MLHCLSMHGGSCLKSWHLPDLEDRQCVVGIHLSKNYGEESVNAIFSLSYDGVDERVQHDKYPRTRGLGHNQRPHCDNSSNVMENLKSNRSAAFGQDNPSIYKFVKL